MALPDEAMHKFSLTDAGQDLPNISPLNEDFEKLGYGIAASPDVPVLPSTLFYSGSTTKAFTAAAASLLVDDEQNYPNINWKTPLNQIIREDFVLPDEYATSHVTLEDALSHRSGLAGHELTLGRHGTVRDVVMNLRHFKMSQEIRSTWQYNNAMYIAVSHMIEVATGEWLGDFLRKHIWEPLNMKSTFFSLDDARNYAASVDNDSTLAVPYGWDEENCEMAEVPYCEGVLSGAGAVISNVLDYSKFIRSVMRQSGPLSKKGYAAMLEPRSFCPQMLPQLKNQILYTLGWMTSTYRGEFIMFHPGGLEGMTATMILFPKREWGVLVFCNADGPGRETLAWYLVDEMLKVPQKDRLDLYDFSQKRLTQKRAYNSIARKRLYPSIPSPNRPLSLPIEEYAGTYSHPAHPDVVISVKSETKPLLHVEVTGSLRSTLALTHVSGDYFLAEISLYMLRRDPSAIVKAEFQVNAEGKVVQFGAAIDFDYMPDTLIWFERSP